MMLITQRAAKISKTGFRRHAFRTLIAAGLVEMFGPGTFAQAEPVNIRLGYGVAAEEQLYLMIAKPDLLKNHGKVYTIEATRFTASDKRAQAFEAGALDLTDGGATNVLLAASEGIQQKIIASVARESTKGFSTTFYTKGDSTINSVADLKGKTVGINGFYTNGHLWLLAALQRSGTIKDTDLTIAIVPFGAMEESLLSGKIDAGMFPQPFAAKLEQDTKVKKLFDAKYGVPFDEDFLALAGRDNFLKANALAIRAFLDDLKDVTKFYTEHPTEARQMLIDTKMVRITPDLYLQMKDWYRPSDLRPDKDALRKIQDLQIKFGFQKNKVDIDTIVDTSYLN
jgi:ABC-type nitrate/sulfonate/bicarbonate transport system substrate-binding protein